MSSFLTPPARQVDPRGQRFGAGVSALVLVLAFGLSAPWLAVLVGLNLAVSAAFGTRLFLPGRLWPILRRTLRLGPVELEHEYPPRFAQALGATFIGLGDARLRGRRAPARLAPDRRRGDPPGPARGDRDLRRLPPLRAALVGALAVRAPLPASRPARRPIRRPADQLPRPVGRPSLRRSMPMSQPHDRVHAFAALLAEERLAGDREFPLKRDVAVFVDELLGILFGQLSEGAAGTADELEARLTLAARDLRHLVAPLADPGETDRIVDAFAAALPDIHDRLGAGRTGDRGWRPRRREPRRGHPRRTRASWRSPSTGSPDELCGLGVRILPRLPGRSGPYPDRKSTSTPAPRSAGRSASITAPGS